MHRPLCQDEVLRQLSVSDGVGEAEGTPLAFLF